MQQKGCWGLCPLFWIHFLSGSGGGYIFWISPQYNSTASSTHTIKWTLNVLSPWCLLCSVVFGGIFSWYFSTVTLMTNKTHFFCPKAFLYPPRQGSGVSPYSWPPSQYALASAERKHLSCEISNLVWNRIKKESLLVTGCFTQSYPVCTFCWTHIINTNIIILPFYYFKTKQGIETMIQNFKTKK